MKTSKILLGIAILALSITACKKDDDTDPVQSTPPVTNPTDPTDPGGSSALSALFESNRASMTQSFSIDATSFQTITASGGTRIQIPGNAFEDQNGNTVQGMVDLEVLEVLTKADMILTNMPTTSGEQLLISGGELQIEAFQNGEELNLAPNMALNISVPIEQEDPNMALFIGEEDDDGNFVDWIEDNTPVIIIADTDTIGFTDPKYNFNFGETGLGWVNCDYFYNSPDPLTTIGVVVPTNNDPTNTSVFLHATNLNSLIGITGWVSSTNAFQSYQNSIPVGLQGTLITISEINGQFYSSFDPITVVNNQIITVSLSSTTYQDILDDINAL